MKAVGTYVTREEAEAVRAEMMKRPATPYQDSTLQDCFRMFKESREYKGRSDKARELYDIAWKYLRRCGTSKLPPSMRRTFKTS